MSKKAENTPLNKDLYSIYQHYNEKLMRNDDKEVFINGSLIYIQDIHFEYNEEVSYEKNFEKIILKKNN
jgi:hypothetical protein